MKSFKSFINEAAPNTKPKAKGEADFVDAHKVEITDLTNQGTEGSANVITKPVSGKRKSDRSNNKQAMGEETEQLDELSPETHKSYQKKADKSIDKQQKIKMKPGSPEAKARSVKGLNRMGGIERSKEKELSGTLSRVMKSKNEESELDEEQLDELSPSKLDDYAKKRSSRLAKAAKDSPRIKKEYASMSSSKTYRDMMKESEFSKKQTTMAHTIGKRFEKKGVGDDTKGGPYAVATAMVRDKPEAAKKAYDTIKSKMKEEIDAELLFKLFDDLNEENQQFFMQQLDEDADALLTFAKNLLKD